MSCTYEATWTNLSSFTSDQQVSSYAPGGIITSTYANTTSGYDTTAFRWRNAQTYLNSVASGTSSSYYKTHKPSETDSPDQLRTKFDAIATGLNTEYCWYMNRYRSALQLLLDSMASTTTNTEITAQRENLLRHTIEMNARLNALTDLVNILATQEAAKMNTYNTQINALNTAIADKSQTLVASAEFIKNNDSLLTTRKEMLRYTAEKNNHITNQISLWAALNVLAIGTIFTIYRNM
jgi:hypothetical protein